MKKILFFVSSVMLLNGATPEQVEKYLLISGSEDQLVEFEQMIDGMGQMFASQGVSGAPLMQDSQMLSIRFKEYLQRNLSEDEMNEIMENYKHDVLRKLVGAQVLMEEPDTIDAYRQFLIRIQSDPLPTNRTEIVKSIVKKLYDEKTLIEFFDKMFVPMVDKTYTMLGRKLNDKQLKAMEKSFVKKMRDNNYNALLFMTRDFDMNELQELDDIAGSSATSHETRAVFGAIVYAMDEALKNMAERFNRMIKQEQQRAAANKSANKEKNSPKESNNTGQTPIEN